MISDIQQGCTFIWENIVIDKTKWFLTHYFFTSLGFVNPNIFSYIFLQTWWIYSKMLYLFVFKPPRVKLTHFSSTCIDVLLTYIYNVHYQSTHHVVMTFLLEHYSVTLLFLESIPCTHSEIIDNFQPTLLIYGIQLLSSVDSYL